MLYIIMIMMTAFIYIMHNTFTTYSQEHLKYTINIQFTRESE